LIRRRVTCPKRGSVFRMEQSGLEPYCVRGGEGSERRRARLRLEEGRLSLGGKVGRRGLGGGWSDSAALVPLAPSLVRQRWQRSAGALVLHCSSHLRPRPSPCLSTPRAGMDGCVRQRPKQPAHASHLPAVNLTLYSRTQDRRRVHPSYIVPRLRRSGPRRGQMVESVPSPISVASSARWI
jgi:hypothetical protein